MRISDGSSDVCSSDLADLVLGLCRQRDADRVADPEPQQAADPDRRFDRARHEPARLGDAEVQRAIDHLGELLIGGDREELVRRSEEHTSELQSLMRISYAVFCLKKKNHTTYFATNTPLSARQ